MKILLVEDDRKLADRIRQSLEEAGHSVDHLADGADALAHALRASPDVAIVDRMLPGLDGLSVVRALRAAGRDLPVLMLTALADVPDRVAGLSAGADDYLPKPFHFSELEARIAALGRRRHRSPEPARLLVHDLELDPVSRSVTRAGRRIDLQGREFTLLEMLMRNAGRVVTRTLLLEKVWNLDFDPGTSVVETHVSRLRAKVDRPFDLALIHTVRNMGYTLRGPS
jgi:two-component system OmpR family response regulator